MKQTTVIEGEFPGNSQCKLIVTNENVFGILPSGKPFDIPIEKVKYAEFAFFDGVSIITQDGKFTFRTCQNPGDIVRAIKELSPPVEKTETPEGGKPPKKRTSKVEFAISLILGIAIATGGGYLFFHNHLFIGIGLVLISSFLIASAFHSIWEKIPFLLYLIAALLLTLIITAAVFGISKYQSEWSKLSKKDQDRIRDNMEFYEKVKEAEKSR
ncbi:MAG: hypothetical protein IKZ47_06955 [Clostridia bacterium]|nr:hypothetical protein [Clostridia bacterium]